jgi:hypothetical protein
MASVGARLLAMAVCHSDPDRSLRRLVSAYKMGVGCTIFVITPIL